MLLRVKSLCSLLFFLTVPCFAYTSKVCTLLNNSDYAAYVIIDPKKEVVIKPHHTKKIMVDIPFNEVKQNLIDFVADRYYVPYNILTLKTHAGTFFMWRDDRGIVIAKAFEAGMSTDEARPQLAISLDSAEYAKIVGCIFTINSRGTLSVEKIA